MSAIQPLPPDDGSYELVYMLTFTRSIDLFLGDHARRSRSKSGRTIDSYRAILEKFEDTLPDDLDVSELDSDHYRRFLDRFVRHSVGYQATIYSTLNSHAKWLVGQGRIRRNPLDTVPRPRRLSAEDLDVTTVSTADVPRLLAAASTDAERLAIAVLAYLGPRRNAVAALRLRDYDRHRGLIRFHEKGRKTIWKPVPDELAEILDGAIGRGVYDKPEVTTSPAETVKSDAGTSVRRNRNPALLADTGHLSNSPDPGAYLIPSEGPLARDGDRDDRVIWRLVKKVGDAAGVDVHTHALRAAFATFYLENNPNDIVGLKELMGHRSIQTTMVYLRKLDKATAMQPVRSLSWAAVGADNAVAGRFPQRAGIRFGESSVVGAGGFEPPFVDDPLQHSLGTEREAK
jgi:integrase